MPDWYPAPVSGCLHRCGKRFRPAVLLCRPRPGGRNIVGSRRRRGDPAGGSGALAINIPVGAGNLAGFVRLPPRRRSSCISPSAMKAWVLGGLRADRRRPGLGLCGNSWARCDDLGGISTIAWNSPAPTRRGRVCGFFALGPAQSGRRESALGSVVPELSRTTGIQLNARVSLRGAANAIDVPAPDFVPHPDPSMAKPSGDYIPLGGFVPMSCPPGATGRRYAFSVACIDFGGRIWSRLRSPRDCLSPSAPESAMALRLV
jgi:hypothetical protein